jgi:hypothetical protein
MAQPSDVYDSYDAAGSNRESLADLIDLVAQDETPFMSRIAGKGKATATFHEWQTHGLDSVDASNAVIEGDEATTDAITAPVRVGNYTQISDKVARVTRTQQMTDHAGYNDEMAYQVMVKTESLKRDMEAIMTRNQASVAGNASTARKLGSLESWLTSNDDRGAGGSDGGYSAGLTVAATNGTQRAFTETILRNVIRSTANSGGRPGYLMLGTFNKSIASGFTGGSTRFSEDTSKKIVATVDIYVSDYGELKIVWNPQQNDRTGFLLDAKKLKVAYLRPLHTYDLAVTGSSMRKAIEVEYTLEVGNQASHGVIADLTTS